MRIFNLFAKEKDFKCLLITPPPLECNTFYAAMPILAGQLVKNGYNAENLDLNIKFFRTILTEEYLKNIFKRLNENEINFDKKQYEYLSKNVENAVKTYRETQNDNIEHQKAEEIINKTLEFISSAYPNLQISRLGSFENCFTGFFYNWQNIKKMTFDNGRNIFIEYFETVANKIKNQKYDFIAITVPFIGTLIPAFTLARILKQKTKAHITLGGNFLKSEDIVKHPDIFDVYCDSILLGDGEETIVELAKALKTKNSIENISGLVCKRSGCANKLDSIVSNQIKPVTDMQNIANMSLNGLDLNEYMQKCPCIYLMVSKGCYWSKCTFCSLGAKYSRYCIKSVEKVTEDIKELLKLHPCNNWFLFQDDALSPAYLNKLSEKFIEENLNINYSIFARFEAQFTKELLEKLYKSGLRAIYWGLESGSQSMLKKMNKGINLDNAAQILKNTYELGISNMAGIIVNFPTETTQEYNETIEFLKTVEKYVTISPGPFTVMRNSYIQKHPEEYGIEILSDKEFDYSPEWRDTNISQELKQQRWEYFCNCVKNGDFKIDSNKQL